MYYFLDIQLPYNLTTFSGTAEVSHGKTFYLLRQGGGLVEGEVPRVQQRKIFKIGVFFNNNVYLCGMIEIEPITEYERTGYMDYPYIEDPLFEYLNKVANKYWWNPVHDFDEETNEEIFIENPSFVPSWFARRYLDGKINLSTLPLYLEAVQEEVPKKHISWYSLDKTPQHNVQPTKETVPNISMTLKAYRLDISKFWYLCICIKDWVEGKTCEGARIDNNLTPREELQTIVDEIGKLEFKLFDIPRKSKGNAKLTLNVKRKNTIISSEQTLAILAFAVAQFLESDYCKKTETVEGKETRVLKPVTVLDSCELGEKRLTKQMAKTVRLALFYEHLNWFMEQREVDEDLVKNYPTVISTNKDLLISRMAYFTGLSDDHRLLEPDNAGKGYIRTAISGYEKITVKTDNKYYGSGF